MQTYLTNCRECGRTTSRKYAAAHDGRCKRCVEGTSYREFDSRNARIIDSGWQAYAREEGHYDIPDNA